MFGVVVVIYIINNFLGNIFVYIIIILIYNAVRTCIMIFFQWLDIANSTIIKKCSGVIDSCKNCF